MIRRVDDETPKGYESKIPNGLAERRKAMSQLFIMIGRLDDRTNKGCKTKHTNEVEGTESVGYGGMTIGCEPFVCMNCMCIVYMVS